MKPKKPYNGLAGCPARLLEDLIMTYDQFLSHLSAHTGTFRFSYPGNKRCAITAERQIIFACDGTQIDTGWIIYRAAEGADKVGVFTSASELLEAPIYEGRSIRERWDEIEWGRPKDRVAIW